MKLDKLTEAQIRVVCTYVCKYLKTKEDYESESTSHNESKKEVAYLTLCDIMTAILGEEYFVKNEFNNIDYTAPNDAVINNIKNTLIKL